MKKFLCILLALLATGTSLVACDMSGDTETLPEETLPAETEPEESEPEDSFAEEAHLVVTEEGVTIASLEYALTAKIYRGEDGGIYYTLTAADGTVVLNPSAMGICVNDVPLFNGATFTEATVRHFNASYPYLGNFSQMTDDCVAATVGLEKDGYTFSIEVKLYDNGLAYRYNLPATGESRKISGEQSSFYVNGMETVWCTRANWCYESPVEAFTYDAFSQGEALCEPLMIELGEDAGYVSILEGYVEDSFVGTMPTACGNGGFGISNESVTSSADVLTGWRIVNYSPELGDVVTNNIIYHTALGMNEDTSSITIPDWITPGKSVWTWINGSVRYETLKEYTLAAAKLGFEYNIIDEGYTVWDNYEEKLLDLGLFGEKLGVKQILWCAFSPGYLGLQIDSLEDSEAILNQMKEWHMAGIKLDFWPGQGDPFTNRLAVATLENAAKNQIICNYHGTHKPTSFSVRYPNELTREAIRGLECINRGGYAEHALYVCSQYYTRFLAGHADFTPDVLMASQIGSTVVMDSPLFVISTPPDQILASEALEMIKAIPTVWDRTVFLNGEIGQSVSVAKEKDGVWYVGGMVAKKTENVSVDLSKILGDGEYLLTYFKDNIPPGYGVAKTMEKVEKTVTKDTVIEFDVLRAGCGYVMQITKLAMSQYGGEITDPITVTTASADAVVKYTTDGSDPMTSDTAVEYTGAITLTESCQLRVAIVSGDGTGTALSYRFNKIDAE